MRDLEKGTGRSLTVLIADDERLAREELVYLLSREAGVELVGQACSGREALEQARRLRPDALFLDVEMPEGSGLQAARRLREEGSAPMIVFTTAYDRYAVEAFGVEAVDYLLKPYEEERLREALARLRQRKEAGTEPASREDGPAGGMLPETEGGADRPLAEAAAGADLSAAPSLEGSVRPSGQQEGEAASAAASPAAGAVPRIDHAGIDPAASVPRKARLLVEDGGRMVVLDAALLLYAAKEDKSTRLRMADGSDHFTRQTLQELEERLGRGFFRPHRSYLVHLDYIKEIEPWFNGAYNLVLKHAEGERIPVSRAAAKDMLRLLEGS
ncbi:LytR/AlgR family response regulator transcription factor [Paenibacillus sp. B01]|uniref:LytR/AlgR family response regulator transcription factor n=1 Tax=Paenibacillus sp. B01 TaxID=2660554 RepID=UPI001E56B5ED|nr:response regulator transcription factor [Paenibacillus sp. B01]